MNNKSWFKHYDKGVPYTLAPYPERTLVDVVSESAGQRPNHPALLFQGTTISYGKLQGLSDAFEPHDQPLLGLRIIRGR